MLGLEERVCLHGNNAPGTQTKKTKNSREVHFSLELILFLLSPILRDLFLRYMGQQIELRGNPLHGSITVNRELL